MRVKPAVSAWDPSGPVGIQKQGSLVVFFFMP